MRKLWVRVLLKLQSKIQRLVNMQKGWGANSLTLGLIRLPLCNCNLLNNPVNYETPILELLIPDMPLSKSLNIEIGTCQSTKRPPKDTLPQAI